MSKLNLTIQTEQEAAEVVAQRFLSKEWWFILDPEMAGLMERVEKECDPDDFYLIIVALPFPWGIAMIRKSGLSVEKMRKILADGDLAKEWTGSSQDVIMAYSEDERACIRCANLLTVLINKGKKTIN